MSFLQVNQGSQAQLDYATGNGGFPLDGSTMRLFTNNHTPTVLDTTANYTEGAWSGYAAVPLTGWIPSTINGLGQAQSNPSPAGFGNNSGSPQIVYGYYVTDSTGTVLLGAELFIGGPISIAAGFGLLISWLYATIHA